MAISSVGTTVTFGSIAIGELKTLSLPTYSNEDVDLTRLEDAAKVYKPGMQDPGQCQMTVFYHEGATEDPFALYTAWAAKAGAEAIVITFSDGTLTLSGWIADMGFNFPEGGGAIEVSLTFQLTGTQAGYAAVA